MIFMLQPVAEWSTVLPPLLISVLFLYRKKHIHGFMEKRALHTRVHIARYAHTNEDFDKIAGTISLTNDYLLTT
jgi:hypothetical protein